MAAGTTIKNKRKAGAFVGGELAAGEFGVDVTNADVYFSVDGSTVTLIDISKIESSGYTTSAEIASAISDETGSGALVFGTSPTLVTPTIGAASATSVNKVALTEPATGATLELADNSTLETVGAFTVAITASGATAITLPTTGTLATTADIVAAVTGLAELKGGYNASTNTPDLDASPSGIFKGDTYRVTAAGNFFAAAVEIGDTLQADQDDPTLLSHWTVLQTNLDGAALTASGLDQFAATTSAELRGVISDETGTGSAVFADSPTLTSPTIDEIVNTGTLSLPTSNDTLVGRATTDTLTNKTISASTNTIDGGSI